MNGGNDGFSHRAISSANGGLHSRCNPWPFQLNATRSDLRRTDVQTAHRFEAASTSAGVKGDSVRIIRL